jgi:hypothetical protein
MAKTAGAPWFPAYRVRSGSWILAGIYAELVTFISRTRATTAIE